MVWSVRGARRWALVVLAAGSAAAAVSMTSVAMFRSSAQPQLDTFAAGRVTLGVTAPGATCHIADLVPGEAGTCRYTVRYTGSVPAWVGLDVRTGSVARATYTPPGGVTAMGGRVLLGALNIALTDSWGDTLAIPTCAPLATAPASCAGAAEDQLLADPATHGMGAAAGSWSGGTQDTITLRWSLPLSAGNAVAGASAQVTLAAHAVQAADNPLVDGLPRAGWRTEPSGATLVATPDALAFGAVVDGQSAAAKTVTLINNGGLATAPLNLSLTGADTQSFSLAQDGCADLRLAPGASCATNVAFTPEAVGRLAAALQATAGAVAVRVPLSGQGEADPPMPNLQLAAEESVVGSSAHPVLVGALPATVTVNLADRVAPVANLAIQVGGAGWSLDGDSCPQALAVGARCTITLAFAPTRAGLSGGLPTTAAVAEAGSLRVTSAASAAGLQLTGMAAWGCTGFDDNGYRGCALDAAQFQDDTLTGDNLSGATLTRANLFDAVAVGTNLRYADMADADLASADLAGADLTGANLSGAIMTAVTWNGAICPDGTAADGDGGSCLDHLTP